jgi:hypothetical protein
MNVPKRTRVHKKIYEYIIKFLPVINDLVFMAQILNCVIISRIYNFQIVYHHAAKVKFRYDIMTRHYHMNVGMQII